ncbi:MAG: metal ABC transporter permease, partial [Actinobacteria bacterium]|nr:metal ABC transporter permease [Actinomycetota bacterium]
GLGYFLGLNPIIIALPFSLASAAIIGLMNKKSRISEDTAIGIVWALGMALGILFLNLTPGYAPDLFSYLFGNILTIPLNDIYIIAGLDLLIIIIALIFHREFTAIAFDEEYAVVIGIPVRKLYFLLLGLVSLSVVILIRIVGVILVIALLTIPASICRLFTFNLKKMIFASILAGIAISISGLAASYFLNLASGATVIITAGIVFLIAYAIKAMANRKAFKSR